MSLGYWLIIYLKKVFIKIQNNNNNNNNNNVLIAFFISCKSGVKTFLKWIISQCPESTR